MLTLFAIPKPFQGHIAIIQRNAIQSWRRLHPDCEIILCGDDFGTKEAAVEFGAKYIPNIARNKFGTPLLNSAFEQAEREASQPLLCYVNADILLMNNFLSAIQSITFQKFLLVGQRWDVDLTEPWNFGTNEWERQLEKYVVTHGSLHPSTGIDYLVFPRGMIGALPPFAVGRPGWDNWFIFRARSLGIPVIDATRVTTVVHQNHDYAHVKQATDDTTEGPEADRNRELVGGWEHFFTIQDATYFLTPNKWISTSSSYCIRRHLRTLPVPLLKARKKLGYIFGAGMRALKRRLSSKK